MVDTHCHLNFDSFDKDRQEVITRARQAGVIRILNPGIDVVSSREAVSMAEVFPEVYAAVGVHPNSATSWNSITLSALRELAQHPKVVAIGEIGLDYYRDRAPRDLQRRVFEQQLELAADSVLPVIVHTRNASARDRRATRDALDLLASWIAELKAISSNLEMRPGVLHSFSDNLLAAKRAANLNLFIGISGPVTFRKAQELCEVVAHIQIEHIVLETDAPFLTPHPHRGKRNEPAYVQFVAQEVAQIRRVPVELVGEAIKINSERLFHWQVTS